MKRWILVKKSWRWRTWTPSGSSASVFVHTARPDLNWVVCRLSILGAASFTSRPRCHRQGVFDHLGRWFGLPYIILGWYFVQTKQKEKEKSPVLKENFAYFPIPCIVPSLFLLSQPLFSKVPSFALFLMDSLSLPSMGFGLNLFCLLLLSLDFSFWWKQTQQHREVPETTTRDIASRASCQGWSTSWPPFTFPISKLLQNIFWLAHVFSCSDDKWAKLINAVQAWLQAL